MKTVVVVEDQINVLNAKKKAICQENVLTVSFHYFFETLSNNYKINRWKWRWW
jgi:hypothetical protein